MALAATCCCISGLGAFSNAEEAVNGSTCMTRRECVPRATPRQWDGGGTAVGRRWDGGGTAVGEVCGDDDGAEKGEGACRRVWRRVVVGAVTKLARCALPCWPEKCEVS